MEYRILVVDDEEAITRTLKSAFIQQGYDVLTAANGQEANEIIDNNTLDLILLDIEMPEVTGLEVLAGVKKKSPDTKVVIITGFGEYEGKARSLKCDAFIKKPFAIGNLKTTIEQLLKKKGHEEIKSYSFGAKCSVQQGSPMAAILLVEPIQEIAKHISLFMSNNSKSGGSYAVYPVDSKEQAIAIQETLHTNIVLIDLKTAKDPGDIMDTLEKGQYPPKDFIFYLRPDAPIEDKRIKESSSINWEGNPMSEESLKDLAELIGLIAAQHKLLKE